MGGESTEWRSELKLDETHEEEGEGHGWYMNLSEKDTVVVVVVQDKSASSCSQAIRAKRESPHNP